MLLTLEPPLDANHHHGRSWTDSHFGWVFPIGRVGGIRITIESTALFLLPLLALTLRLQTLPSYLLMSETGYWCLALALTAGIVLSVFLHEWTHSRVARRLGEPPRGFTLFLFGAADEPHPGGRWQNIALYASGIAFSLVAGLTLLALSFYTETLLAPRVLSTSIFLIAAFNLLFAALQSLPALPLDGGRIVLELFTHKGRITRAVIWLLYFETLAFAAAMVFYGVSFLTDGRTTIGAWVLLIAFALGKAGLSECEFLRVRTYLEGRSLANFINSEPICVPSQTPDSVFRREYTQRYAHRMFPVCADDGVLEGMRSRRSGRVIPTSPDNTVAPDIGAEKALDVMVQSGNPRLLVAEHGKLVGIVSYGSLFQSVFRARA